VSQPGVLYLLPVPISLYKPERFFSAYHSEVIQSLRYFIAEDAKVARRNLKWFGYANLPDADIQLLNEHSREQDLSSLFAPLLRGENVGLMSDAGCPGIADPGAAVVRLAHQLNIRVETLVGPSSIVMSIMASGFNGQNFAFVGYLPVEGPARQKRIRELESLSEKQYQAQFFIETPYRNVALFDALLQSLKADTQVFIGRDFGSEQALVQVKTVKQWKQLPKPELHKIPVVFGLYTH
jgi:16S rRNA (cytidine1402-2'-O)-methyltransferase